ncbi:MAG: M3 family metallopeptidase, partial [Stenotrophobium sp.]
PRALFERMRAAKNFQSGMQFVRQLEFAMFDMRLHHGFDPERDDIQATLDEVRRLIAVYSVPAYNRFANQFSHIFAGGYAAGYYSYKWAEVLSADAYAAFEESHFAAETGQRFRDTVLAQGGSREAMDLFIEFRGRKPRIEPLLRQAGLLDAAA